MKETPNGSLFKMASYQKKNSKKIRHTTIVNSNYLSSYFYKKILQKQFNGLQFSNLYAKVMCHFQQDMLYKVIIGISDILHIQLNIPLKLSF